MLLLAEAMWTVQRVCNSSASLFSSRVKQNHFIFVSHLNVCDFLFYEKKPKPKNPRQPQPKKKKSPKKPNADTHNRFGQVGVFFLSGGLPCSFLLCPNSHAILDWPHLWLHRQFCLTAAPAADCLSSPPLQSTHNSSGAGGTYQSKLAPKTRSEVLHDNYRASDCGFQVSKAALLPKGNSVLTQPGCNVCFEGRQPMYA